MGQKAVVGWKVFPLHDSREGPLDPWPLVYWLGRGVRGRKERWSRGQSDSEDSGCVASSPPLDSGSGVTCVVSLIFPITSGGEACGFSSFSALLSSLWSLS